VPRLGAGQADRPLASPPSVDRPKKKSRRVVEYGGASRSVGVGSAEIGGSTPRFHNGRQYRKFRQSAPEADREKKDNCPRHRAEWSNNELHYRIVAALNHFPSLIRRPLYWQTTNAVIANSP
jgi:hypothetical protein